MSLRWKCLSGGRHQWERVHRTKIKEVSRHRTRKPLTYEKTDRRDRRFAVLSSLVHGGTRSSHGLCLDYQSFTNDLFVSLCPSSTFVSTCDLCLLKGIYCGSGPYSVSWCTSTPSLTSLVFSEDFSCLEPHNWRFSTK